jgi:putative ABC transport system ATP-binding protein
MSHGTAAPAPGRAAGNGHPGPGGLPFPGDVPADDGRPGSAPPAVRVRRVRRSFEAEMAPVRALRGLDLDVAAGEFVALMGPSGCGKSTLLNVIAGLDQPDEGSVEVAGERIDGRDEEWLARFRRQHVGVIFQFFSLLDGVSVLDNLMLPGILGGMRRRAAVSRARDLLGLLGVGEDGGRPPSALSGGQRQRLAIARALVNYPDLLLADEPTGALDSEGAQEVLALLRQLHAGGQTIIMVTHAPEVAAAADRIVRMRDGRVEGRA